MFKPASLLLCALTATLPWAASYADIYKTVDDEGNVNFTDAPGDKPAEQVKLKPSTIISPPTIVPPDPQAPSSADSFSYRSLTIKKPVSGATIALNGDVTVLATISPRLRPADRLQLVVDGKAHGNKQKGLSFKVKNLGRGPHTIDVQALNSKGKILNTASVTVYSHNPSGIKNTATPSGSPSLAPQAPMAPQAPTAPRAPNAPTVPAGG
ncbi:DUF4124 domain-containing protein [Endozoicomonas sp. SM1973]|uniref:DUF4124 domain-containing protein n=1 Tax=Spartinivicinus marinus TaxID=2994442 RepID=A0A853IAL1_9GAMM|nr:DUF4124 domain-containing protein [Spartinivicinus marinus]MCX4026509.1 DUF4124 domain-containing protein [Spartinivicinus marinus]NYZ66881.1 DUF4124 domain-containing protein [Spartinivicinus marinus]